jgi:hypothetical protein
MNAAWASSLDQLWRSASLPMWLALGVAALFGLIVLVALLRAEKSVANGALTMIALLAVGVAATVVLRGAEPAQKAAAPAPVAAPQLTTTLPVLSCLDELAGEMVLAACEKSLFASPDTVAAAVSATAALVDRLTSYGDVGNANRQAPPDLATLRNAVERDRYGFVAYVLQSRDRCRPDACFAFPSIPDYKQVASNMGERFYEGLLTRYAPAWNAPPAAAAASAVPGVASLSGLPPSLPTGKPTNAEFPSSSSIPPISIMTDTPVRAPAADAKAAPRPAPKKQAAPKEAAPAAPRPQAAAPAAPVQLAPGAPQADN